MIKGIAAGRKGSGCVRQFVFLLAFGMLALAAGPSAATSIVPISDPELYARADAIVHGIVVSNQVGEDAFGRPETVTRIAPLAVLKGQITGELVLHQLGGTLPDGRFFKLSGTPGVHRSVARSSSLRSRIPKATTRPRSFCWASSRSSRTSADRASRCRRSSPMIRCR